VRCYLYLCSSLSYGSNDKGQLIFIGDAGIITNLNGKDLQVLLGAQWYDIDPFMTTDIQNMVEQVNPQPCSESGYYSSSGK